MMSNRAVNTYDVIVIGAGPSGSTAGTALAKDGFSVLVVDKAEFPRDKPCGGLLSAKSTSLLGKLLDQSALERAVRVRSHGCRLFYRESLVTEVQNSASFTLVSRRELDLQMRRAAEKAGCEVRERSRVIDVDIRNGTVRFSSGVEIRGRFIVAADGARSIASGFAAKQSNSHNRGMGFGLVTEIPLEQVKDGHERDKLAGSPSIFFGIIPWGYGWIFPHGSVLNVGVGGLLGSASRYRETIRDLIKVYFGESVAECCRVTGQVVPYGRFGRRPGRENVLLVGDAAGFVEPVTGEGIAYAIESGLLAAQAIHEAHLIGNPYAAGNIYNSILKNRVIKPLRHAAIARWLLFPRLCLPLAMRTLRKHPELSRWYCELMAGEMSYPQYFRRMITAIL